MKKLFLFLLLFLLGYIVLSFYFLDKCYFLCPIEYKGDIVIRHDSRGNGFFAAQRNGRRIHEGIDLYAEVGTPVLASRSGVVVAARKSKGMGNFVIVRHNSRIITIYGHLSKIFVRRNEFVSQGEVIGSVGKTGNANSPDIKPHLHFEVRKNGRPQDPWEYLQ
ncbi:MAG: M23 family metallopeptidase [Candidatus Omnitrophica bacterium]|nr:M23 family metallopeptidase [Candidatus Omnitrophota bacterium]MDD5592173.1 M23 family metallopeptidase [Candidatus Omnitrophota bacterium]